MEETEKKDDLLPLWTGPDRTGDQEYIETHPITFKEPQYELERKKAQCMDDVPMIPKKGRIIVRQNEFVQRSAIYIPPTAQQKPTTGVVVAIGPDVEEGFVRLGEVIVFSQYGGIPLNIVDGEGNQMPFLSLTSDEIAGELIVDPSKVVRK